MPSAEGKGRAQKAWAAYSRTTNRILKPVLGPVLGPLIKNYSAGAATDILGFWLVWHLHGGHAGLRELGMSRASIYRKVSLFRKAVGVHPDEFELPGVKIDVAAYMNGMDSVRAQQKRAAKESTS